MNSSWGAHYPTGQPQQQQMPANPMSATSWHHHQPANINNNTNPNLAYVPNSGYGTYQQQSASNPWQQQVMYGGNGGNGGFMPYGAQPSAASAQQQQHWPPQQQQQQQSNYGRPGGNGTYDYFESNNGGADSHFSSGDGYFTDVKGSSSSSSAASATAAPKTKTRAAGRSDSKSGGRNMAHLSQWRAHLNATHAKMRARNPDATLKQAMTVASKTYKKSGNRHGGASSSGHGAAKSNNNNAGGYYDDDDDGMMYEEDDQDGFY